LRQTYFPAGWSIWKWWTWPSLLRGVIAMRMLLPVLGQLVARCQRSGGTVTW
jgi:hypothetical protein